MRKKNAPSDQTPETGSAQALPIKKRRFIRRLVKTLLWLGSVFATLAIVSLLGFFVWSMQDGSLASLLKFFGADKTERQFEGVEGSLYRGGRISHLDWSASGVRVQADNLRADWRLLGLLRKNLKVNDAQTDYLRITYTTAPKSDVTPSAPTSITLPLNIVVGRIRAKQFEVFSKSIDQPEVLQFAAHDLDGSYSYQGQQHSAKVKNIAFADGNHEIFLQHFRIILFQFISQYFKFLVMIFTVCGY